MTNARILNVVLSAAWIMALGHCVGCEVSRRQDQVGQGSLLYFPEARNQEEHDRLESEIFERLRRIERDAWIPVQIVGPGSVRAIEYHGSGHLNALTRADGLVCIPRGIRELAAGTRVDVRQF